MSKSLVRRGSGVLANQDPPSTVGKVAITGGTGALAVLGLAAMLPGGVLMWAIIMIVLGIFFF